MKKIVFSDHADKRRRQRGFTSIEIEFILERPKYKRKRRDGKIEIIGILKNRQTKIVHMEEENYINIVSVMVIV